MKIVALSTKEKLILNELIHKYNFNHQWSEKEVRNLHDQLLGFLTGKWDHLYILKQRQKKDLNALVYSLLILPLTYPLLHLSNTSIKEPSSFYWKTRLSPFFNTIEDCLPSVGRLLKKNEKGQFKQVASGFQISGKYFISIFIAEQEAEKNKTTYWVDFSNERKLDQPAHHFKVKQIIRKQDAGWMLLKVNQFSNSGKHLPLSIKRAGVSIKTDFIVMIGYPRKIDKHRNDLLGQYSIFGTPQQLGDKRISLGHLYRSQSKWEHDCSASHGSEGSPIFHPESGRVIGIHLKNKNNSISYMINLTKIKASEFFKVLE